ncbi:MAG: RHS repeat-associated core domain-containing protein, partial [Candidatus Hydrogenedentota bacterium]
RKDERLYLGGFEVYRDYNGNGTAIELERETLHIMDDTRRIAMVETKTIDINNDPSPTQLIRYQFGNHLGSASLELDNESKVISYEEYFPYGSTSYQAMDKNIKAAAKRFRYTGKERDDETGLYYHGARYYACWLGRWMSADPMGTVDGTNLFAYVRGSPVVLSDPSGGQAEVPDYETLKAERAYHTEHLRSGTLTVEEITTTTLRLVEVLQAIHKIEAAEAEAMREAMVLEQAYRYAYAQEQAAAKEYKGPAVSVDPIPWEVTRERESQRMWAEYYERNPSAAMIHAKGWQRFASAIDPVGAGSFGAGTFGVSMLFGSTPEQAAFDARLVEAGGTAFVIFGRVPVTGTLEGPSLTGTRPGISPPGKYVSGPPRRGGQQPHLHAGRVFERQQLATMGRRHGTQTFRPSPEEAQSAAFRVIVGEPKYTRGGQLRGTIFDVSEGAAVEIKGGRSPLGSSYQLRLQTYHALKQGVPFELRTSRPLRPEFADWLNRWGVQVTRP